jgi:tetratricopeptide (TPR) repeat protein
MVALIHEARGDGGADRVQYEQALVKDPSAGVAANNLAWAYAEEGRLDDALALAKKAQSVLRGRPEAEDTLGWVYLKRHQPRDAITAFERAIKQAPQKAAYLSSGAGICRCRRRREGRRGTSKGAWVGSFR